MQRGMFPFYVSRKLGGPVPRLEGVCYLTQWENHFAFEYRLASFMNPSLRVPGLCHVWPTCYLIRVIEDRMLCHRDRTTVKTTGRMKDKTLDLVPTI